MVGGSTSTYRSGTDGGRRSIKPCEMTSAIPDAHGGSFTHTSRQSTLSMHHKSVFRLSNSSGMTFERLAHRSMGAL